MEKNCGNCDYCAENGEDLVCVNVDLCQDFGHKKLNYSLPT